MAPPIAIPIKLVTALASFIKRSILYNSAISDIGISPNLSRVKTSAKKPDPGTPDAVLKRLIQQ